MRNLTRRASAFVFRLGVPSVFFGTGLVSLLLLGNISAIAQTDVDDDLDSPVNDSLSSAKATVELTFASAQTSLIQNTFIAAPVSGVISEINVTEGDEISRHTTLVAIEDELAQKELLAAKAGLDAARIKSENDVNLRYAKRTWEVRDHEMRQGLLANEAYAGVVSEMDLQDIRLKVDQAALAIEQAEHELMIAQATSAEKTAELSIAQTRLDRHAVRTGVGGMVVEIDVEVGEWVEAGAPMVRIVSLDPIRIECFVDGRKHGRELIGRDAVFIVDDSESAAISGKVSFISPELHPVTGQVRLWATMNNPGGKIGSGTPGKLVLK